MATSSGDAGDPDRVPVDASGPRLTAGAVARQLGVAVTTLRTWDRRYGLGPTDHVPGRHRRYTVEDLRRLELMRVLVFRGVPPADAARAALSADGQPLLDSPARTVSRGGGGRVIPVGRAGATARGLAKAASSMDGEAIGEIVRSSIEAHGTVPTWNEVLVPVLVGIGRRWESDERWVEIEHLLSWHVSSALRAVPYGLHRQDRPGAGVAPEGDGRRPPGEVGSGGLPDAPTLPSVPRPARVLLAATADEQHTLPLEALGATLREEGVGSWMLGARVPDDALLEAARRTGPSVVVLWAQVPATARWPLLRRLAGAGPALTAAAAGPGWSAELPAEVIRPLSLAQAANLVRDSLAGASRHARPPAAR